MAYASFRCLVHAPMATVWQRLKAQVQTPERSGAAAASTSVLSRIAQGSALRELVEIDADHNEIIVRLMSGQTIQGERRYVLRQKNGQSEAFLDAILNWESSSSELDRELMQAAVELLVRDFALEVKQAAEVA